MTMRHHQPYSQNPLPRLSEAARVLKPGGTIILF
jgi:ubiquinone/menaquinone biosynthesis C-methylase UbiE